MCRPGKRVHAWYCLGAMRAKLDIGRTFSRQTRVEEWMTAEKAGNKGVDVLSTPMLVQLIEDAAMACVAPAARILPKSL